MDETRQSVYAFGSFSLDTNTRRLLRDGQYVPLMVKTFDILLLLVQNQGRLVTKKELMNAVWPDQFVEENNLTVRVSALRRALGEKLSEHKYIETVSGHGYRFVASVKELGNEEAGEVGWKLAQAQGETMGARAGGVMYLAVLPFTNENADPDTEYLSEGITESLINSLSRLSRLKVLAQATTRRYKGQGIDPYSVGQELGVKAMLVGRLLLDGRTLVVSAELMSNADRSHIWSARYQRPLSDLFFLQEEMAREISESLRVRLIDDETNSWSRRYSHNSDAYLFYLKGRYFWNKRSVEGILKAVEYFQKAIEVDPGYALAHAGLSDAYILLADFGILAPSETVPTARRAIIRALDIDDRLAEAHAAQANIMSRYDWDLAGAETEYRRAIKLNPSYAPAYQWYALHLAKTGRFPDALLAVKKAQHMEPLSLSINRSVAWILYLARQYEQAIKQCLEILELDKDFGPIYGPLGLCYIERQMYEAAIATFQNYIDFAIDDYQSLANWNKESSPQLPPQVSRSEPDPEALGLLAYTYAQAKNREKAVAILNKLLELSERRYTEPHAIAIIYIGLGDSEQAFKWLERSYAERSYVLTYLGVWPVFDSLRSDQRFTSLLRRIGFAA